ncbi:glucose-6-phosphate isomerase [Longispora fulva]|uniref:Glucose-6-phosphate isomerase n=1 Tax=Longispora fulva TaxID=619741 RepID=A0A8J7GQ05_9ACTN|nr:glucose-6-phosphate isomerase [Longispora fulva]MBG6141307.1 glucose-6-phosphate isomerase [Longispora fulva]GIG59542.1 glucose-6-phosphate isomerase [Longispora fulva]
MIAGGGLTVRGSVDAGGVLAALTAEDVPALLAAGDATLWGPEAEPEASIRLGWLKVLEASQQLVDRLAKLRAELLADGLDHVVLAGMGGSSLAPEVICRTLGVDLTVLDTTDPGQVRAAVSDRLDRTVLVVSSKSGGTVETDSHRRAYLDAGLDPARQLIVVTDPGSPLEAAVTGVAREVFLADPTVGGRYSALTAFGLVPSALAGVDVSELLAEAAALHATLADPAGPATALGAILGAAALAGRDKLAIADDGSGIVGLGDWIEQLIAESTGKAGVGILPVVLESPTAPVAGGPDVLRCTVGGAMSSGSFLSGGLAAPELSVSGGLGAHFLAWEFATALAGRVLVINPFDQPNVQESKDNTNRLLASGLPTEKASSVDGAVEVYGDMEAFFHGVGDDNYVAVLAYLDRHADADAEKLRALIAERTGRPVTFGWGPRFLHSTGQYHKGGPAKGVFLQITGAVAEDLPIGGKEYTFGALQAAQAAGDREALAQRDRPVLHLHLTDRAAGIAQLLAALR